MKRRHWLLCLATGSLLKTAEGVGLAAPLVEEATTVASFDSVTLLFKLQRRWVNDDITDPDFTNPYWDKAHVEYRYAAVHPHTGDIIVADEETAARWNAELETAFPPLPEGWSKVVPADPPIANLLERKVIVHPAAWKS